MSEAVATIPARGGSKRIPRKNIREFHGKPIIAYSIETARRSQDLEPAYHDAGQFYWGRTSAFRERREMFSPESAPVILPRELLHDIDTPEDWANAELAFAALRLAESRRL
jgi:CMP-N-acetylneuraminic acid synthetase